MKIFVTGFDGYVGREAVTALLQRGADITALCRNAQAAAKAGLLGLASSIVSLDNPAALAEAVRGHDAVAHFAASDRPEFLPVNRAAIDAMISALPHDGSFVTHGGSLVFGEQGRLAPAPEPSYNAPAALVGRAALDEHILASSTARRTYIVYGSLVFGGMGDLIPMALMDAARMSDSSAYPGDGEAIWSAVHIEDWADLIARALYQGPAGAHAVFAAAQEIRVSEAAALVGQMFSPPKPARSVSIEDARARYPFFADALTLFQRYDNAPTRRIYDWAPAPRDFSTSLRELADLRSRM